MISFKVDEPKLNLALEHLIKAFESHEDFNKQQNISLIFETVDGVYFCHVFIDDIKEETRQFIMDDCYEVLGKNLKSHFYKKLLYDVLHELTGINLPWGILTGVRPTKVVRNFLSQGLTYNRIQELLKEIYRIDQRKIQLLFTVAHKEQCYLDSQEKNEMSVYIGIPFCPTRCLYCSFTAYSLKDYQHLVDQYVERLIHEIKSCKLILQQGKIRTLYIGGGTPTALSANQLDRLLREVTKIIDINKVGEFTVEAGRPDTITEDKLKVLRDYGVSRISINPQTMKEETLNIIGRAHTTEQVYDSYELARRLGFDNINMDFILGLPGENLEDLKTTCEIIKTLKPDSFTMHTLAIKKGSRLKECLERYELTSRTEIEDMINVVEDTAKALGLEPYYLYRQKNMVGNFENVGYASVNKESIYNMLIIEESEDIIAFGAGAITKLVNNKNSDQSVQRVENVKNIMSYIERTDEMVQRKLKYFS